MDPVLAVVQSWNGDEGWGVCSAEQLPGGCWVHFSVVDLPGHRHLTEGDAVWLVPEVGEQDGYRFRATRCWPLAASADVAGTPLTRVRSEAYVSRLHLSFDDDDPTVSRWTVVSRTGPGAGRPAQ